MNVPVGGARPLNSDPRNPQEWKYRVCIGCGAHYRFWIFEGTPGQPQNGIYSDDNARPCPACGILQPEMISGQQRFLHGFILALSICVGVLGYILVEKELSIEAAAVVVATGWALTAGLHLAVLLRNPNSHSNRAANRVRTQLLLQSGAMVLDRQGTNASPVVVPGSKSVLWARLAGLALVLLAGVGPAAPKAVRLALGWPLNPDFQPPIVGPGETSRLYLPHTIASVGGRWRGSVTCTCLNSADIGAPSTFAAAAGGPQWGNDIKARSYPLTTKLWTDVTVPSTPALEGRAAELLVDLKASFPELVRGQNSFKDGSYAVSHQVSLRLAPAGAARTYSWLWTLGLLGGVASAVIGGLVLMRASNNLTPRS